MMADTRVSGVLYLSQYSILFFTTIQVPVVVIKLMIKRVCGRVAVSDEGYWGTQNP